MFLFRIVARSAMLFSPPPFLFSDVSSSGTRRMGFPLLPFQLFFPPSFGAWAPMYPPPFSFQWYWEMEISSVLIGGWNLEGLMGLPKPFFRINSLFFSLIKARVVLNFVQIIDVCLLTPILSLFLVRNGVF